MMENRLSVGASAVSCVCECGCCEHVVVVCGFCREDIHGEEVHGKDVA